MSNNPVRVAFSFKGETCELDSVIDLDGCLGEPGEEQDRQLVRLLIRRISHDSTQ